tara:strand:+ start:10406 stop:11068 length:663 start_codon:yes stop_codon:yes gene_type:complete
MSVSYDATYKGQFGSSSKSEESAPNTPSTESADTTGSRPTTDSLLAMQEESSGSTDPSCRLLDSVHRDLRLGSRVSHHGLSEEDLLERMDAVAACLDDKDARELLRRYIRLYKTRLLSTFMKMGCALDRLRAGLPPHHEAVQEPLRELVHALMVGKTEDLLEATYGVERLSPPSETEKVYTEEDLARERRKGYEQGRHENLEEKRVARHRRWTRRPMQID